MSDRRLMLVDSKKKNPCKQKQNKAGTDSTNSTV